MHQQAVRLVEMTKAVDFKKKKKKKNKPQFLFQVSIYIVVLTAVKKKADSES